VGSCQAPFSSVGETSVLTVDLRARSELWAGPAARPPPGRLLRCARCRERRRRASPGPPAPDAAAPSTPTADRGAPRRSDGETPRNGSDRAQTTFSARCSAPAPSPIHRAWPDRVTPRAATAGPPGRDSHPKAPPAHTRASGEPRPRIPPIRRVPPKPVTESAVSDSPREPDAAHNAYSVDAARSLTIDSEPVRPPLRSHAEER